MARQSTTPVKFNQTSRRDKTVLMSSARAGKVVPVAFIPLLRGDRCAGQIGIDITLGEMPRPLYNGVQANFQAWFVPKTAHAQFTGIDEFNHAWEGTQIESLGAANRTPPLFFNEISSALTLTTIAGSEFMKTLGIHIPAGEPINTDLIDAFWLIYNFRKAAVSKSLARSLYYSEDAVNSLLLPRCFWPASRLSRVVPDYESALIKGQLNLDVVAGRVPVSGIGVASTNSLAPTGPGTGYDDTFGANLTYPLSLAMAAGGLALRTTGATAAAARADVWAEMTASTISVSLADIDKARLTQSFAKLRAAYAGVDHTGFETENTLIAIMMQGLSVPDDQFNRPWLLGEKRVGIGFPERFATDGANLDKSVSQGMASAILGLNVPQNDVGGLIVVTVEVCPERLDERQCDEWLHCTTVNELPNALRDVQRTEPVDMVLNRRLDAAHTTPSGLYGYEGMNDKWNRDFTRLGGVFHQPTPGTPVQTQRAALWFTNMVNPVYTADHFLCPTTLPHAVFSDTAAPAFEFVARHDCTILGLTQIGDPLVESNLDYQITKAEV